MRRYRVQCGDEGVLDIKKTPYIADMVLHKRTVGAVNVTPEWVAQRLRLECDDGYDELDEFKILILNVAGRGIGFLRHKGSPENFSGVCIFSEISNNELTTLLGDLFPNGEVEFTEYDEPW